MAKVTLEQLVDAGAHFGHQVRRWNPKMQPYLYGVRDNVHVFDVPKTLEKLNEALEVLTKAAKDGKSILFVGTKKQAKDFVKKAASEAQVFYITERWLGGTLTNFDQLLASVRKLATLKENFASGAYAGYTKKERLLLSRKIEKMEKSLGGIAHLTKKPDLMVVIDTHKERGAVAEARMVGIDIIGLVDSNANPDVITYPVPMNDDAAKALELVIGLFGEAVMEGKGIEKKVEKKVEKKKEEGKDAVAEEQETAEKPKEKKAKKTKKEEK
jgi:small subunit ribosomal protein S2